MSTTDMIKSLTRFNKAELAIVKRMAKRVGKKTVTQMITGDGTVWKLAIVSIPPMELINSTWENLDEPSEGDYDLMFVRADKQRFAEINIYGEVHIMHPKKFSSAYKFICFV